MDDLKKLNLIQELGDLNYALEKLKTKSAVKTVENDSFDHLVIETPNKLQSLCEEFQRLLTNKEPFMSSTSLRMNNNQKNELVIAVMKVVNLLNSMDCDYYSHAYQLLENSLNQLHCLIDKLEEEHIEFGKLQERLVALDTFRSLF